MGEAMVGVINFSGLYSWASLHKTILGWLKDRKYDIDDRAYEYAAKTFGEEIVWEVFAKRRQDEYVRFALHTKLIIRDQTQVEIIENEQKKVMDKGRIDLKIFYEVETDYGGMFKKKKLRTMGKFLSERIFGGDKDAGLFWDDTLYYEAQRFVTDIKKALNMSTAYSAY